MSLDLSFDSERLIAAIEQRPLLWDRNDPEYKDKQSRNLAWRQVCDELLPEFEDLDELEKDAYEKILQNKWTNIRDSWTKHVAGKFPNRKPYRYHRQLGFLMETSRPRLNVVKQPKRARVDVKSEPIAGSSESVNLAADVKTEYDENISMAVAEYDENHHISFFKGLLPSLMILSEEQTLEFQGGVIKLLQEIKRQASL